MMSESQLAGAPAAARFVIGLGANLGQPYAVFQQAIERICTWGEPVAYSRAYRTAPVGFTEQPDFINAAILMRCVEQPPAVLRRLLAIERELGRVRKQKWGPRVLDLDILWWSGVPVSLPELQVPHPRLAERAFALAPFLDVLPNAIEARSGRPYTRCLERLQGQQIAVEAHPPTPWRVAAV